MSVWLTPDLKPFAGGTYFPPEDSARRVGFRTLLLRVTEQVRGRQCSGKGGTERSLWGCGREEARGAVAQRGCQSCGWAWVGLNRAGEGTEN